MGSFNSPTAPGARANRWALIAIALIGIGLALAPVAFKMFDRGPKGAAMMADFKPFMTDARLSGFQQHIKDIDAAVHQGHSRVAVTLEGHGAAAHKRFDAKYPSFAQFAKRLAADQRRHVEPADKIQANAGNYRAVAALPSFKLFPWFFVIPGVIVFLLARRRGCSRRARGRSCAGRSSRSASASCSPPSPSRCSAARRRAGA